MTRTTNPDSILARLKNLWRERYPNIPPNAMLQLYAQQGFLARLDASRYGDNCVLKGAMSLFTRYGNAARPTQDLDLATRDFPNTPEQIFSLLAELCAVPFGDGLVFNPASIQVEPINEQLEYPGVKATVQAELGSSQVKLQIDFSFGNVITPAPVELTFPPLLIEEGVQVAVYPLETVITEKFAALVEIGEATTRMKDLYDLHVILGREEFGAELVSQALERSFAARGTPRARVADILGDDFAQDEVLKNRWKQYLSRNRFRAPSFPEVMSELQAFYGPLLLGSQRTGRWGEGKWLDR